MNMEMSMSMNMSSSVGLGCVGRMDGLKLSGLEWMQWRCNFE